MEKPKREPRDQQIPLRVSQSEKEVIEAAAAIEKRSRESFCRVALLEVALAVVEEAQAKANV